MFVVLRNANAGRRKQQPPSRQVIKKMGPQGHLIETSSLHELPRASQDVALANPSLIILWGGDGTVTATLSALISAYGPRSLPPICLIPGGTMNVVARSLTHSAHPEKVFHEVVSLYYKNAPMPSLRRTLIRFEEKYGFLFGIGLLANFLDALYEGNQSGTMRSMYVLGRATLEALWGGGLIPRLFRPFEAKVTVDGALWSQERWVNISGGGVEGLGLGFKPYIRCAEREGAFHLIGHDLSPVNVVMELPGVRMGRGMKNVQQDVAQHVLIETEKPMVYSFEGEIYEPKDRFELHSGPTLQLIAP